MSMIDTQPRILSPEQLAEWTPAQRRYWGKRLPNSVPALPEAEPPRPHVTANRIIAVCAAAGKMSVGELTGSGRRKEISTYRHVAAYLIRKHRKLSLSETGRKIGRDHSTTLLAIRKVEEDLAKGGKRFGPVISAAEQRLGI